MCDKQKYFVFTYDHNDNIKALIGIRPLFEESITVSSAEEQVDLPQQFMIGKTYNGIVYRSKATKGRLAVLIPIDARPLAL